MKLLRPVLGRLTQGVLFSCATAENYEDTHVYGLIVTARCDIAQSKSHLLSYLPVVSLDAWMAHDGFELLHSRALADAEGRVRNALGAAGLAKSLLDVHTPRAILDTAFDAVTEDHKERVRKDAFQKSVIHYESVVQCGGPPARVRKLYEQADGLKRALLKELVQNKITGYYFLPAVEEGEDPVEHVVLLRQLQSLPQPIAKAVARGLDVADTSQQDVTGRLSFAKETFAMPVGEVPSPEIEHILQCFSMLYGRIGVTDATTEYIDNIVARLPREAT